LCARSAMAVAIHASHVLYNRFIFGSGFAALAWGNLASTAAKGIRAHGSAVPCSNVDDNWSWMACSDVQASNHFFQASNNYTKRGQRSQLRIPSGSRVLPRRFGAAAGVHPCSTELEMLGRTKPCILRISFISSWNYRMYKPVSQPISMTSSV
jgi:hypothetical protein